MQSPRPAPGLVLICKAGTEALRDSSPSPDVAVCPVLATDVLGVVTGAPW